MRTKTVMEGKFCCGLLVVSSCFLLSVSDPAAASDKVIAGKLPLETSRLWSPGKVAVDSSAALLYVVDSYKDRIQSFDSRGTYLGTIPVPQPAAVAVAPDGILYIGSHRDYSVGIYRNAARIGSLGDGSHEFSSVRDLAVDPGTGDIYVVDAEKNRVSVYYSSGQPKGMLSGFHLPAGVAVTDDEVYVLDAPVLKQSGSQGMGTGSRISVFNKNWILLRSIDEYGNADDEMVRPAGIAVDRFGNIFVVDAARKAVLVYNRSGAFVGQFSSSVDLNTSVSLALSRDGRLYVSSSETHSILEIDLTGDVHSALKASLDFKSKTGDRITPAALGY